MSAGEGDCARREEEPDLFYIDQIENKREKLAWQIRQLENLRAQLADTSAVWATFTARIKALQIDLAFLDREIQHYRDSFKPNIQGLQ